MNCRKIFIVVSSLLASTAVLANTTGPTPKCTSGKLNMEIYVKDVDSCPNDMANAEYCIYDMWAVGKGDQTHGDSCEDFEDLFYKNDNESVSLRKKPNFFELQHLVGSHVNDQFKTQRLRFTYNHGSVSNNCSEVFGSDVKCVVTRSGSSKHPLYRLTISKR